MCSAIKIHWDVPQMLEKEPTNIMFIYRRWGWMKEERGIEAENAFEIEEAKWN